MAHDDQPTQSDPLHELCLDCGLCCDGTLFEAAELEPKEQPRLIALGLVPVGKSALALPCLQHIRRCCAIYEQRPTTCARFTCKLYDSLGEGSLSKVAARERIESVRQLCRAIEQLLDWAPESFSTARFRTWVADFQGGEVEARRLYPQAFLKYGVLRMSINRHFA